jgi:hypothetical protein
MSKFKILLAYAEKLFVVSVGGLAAASIYFLIAIRDRQIFSFYVLEYALLIALLSIPAFIIAVNLGRVSAAAIIIAVSVSLIMGLQAFGQTFIAGLPGTDWVTHDELVGLLIMPYMAVAALVARRPHQILLLIAACAVSLVILIVGLQLAVRAALEQQFSHTLANGGCVIAGYDLPREQRRKVNSQAEVQRGWFIGRDIEPVYFVFPHHYLRWSFSKLGVVNRYDLPVRHSLYEDIRC